MPERVGHGDEPWMGVGAAWAMGTSLGWVWGQRGMELGTGQVSVCLEKAFLGGRWGHSRGAGSRAG